MAGDKGELDVDDLLKIVLVLVAIWLVIAIAGEILELTLGLLGPLQPLLGVVVFVLIVLWLLDRI